MQEKMRNRFSWHMPILSGVSSHDVTEYMLLDHPREVNELFLAATATLVFHEGAASLACVSVPANRQLKRAPVWRSKSKIT